MSQSNTRVGDFPVAAGVDLSGMEGRLVKMTHDGGAPEAALPTDNADYALYALVEGASLGGTARVRPLEAGRNARVRLKGTCNPGDAVVLADTATEADRGMVRAVPEDAGTYRGIGIAEEAGVDGQLALIRPAMLGEITVV